MRRAFAPTVILLLRGLVTEPMHVASFTDTLLVSTLIHFLKTDKNDLTFLAWRLCLTQPEVDTPMPAAVESNRPELKPILRNGLRLVRIAVLNYQ